MNRVNQKELTLQLNRIYTGPSSHPHINMFNFILNRGFLDSFFEESSTKECQTFEQMEQFIANIGTLIFEISEKVHPSSFCA